MERVKLATFPACGELYVTLQYPQEVIASCESVLTGVVKADGDFCREIFRQKARERLIDALVKSGMEKGTAISILHDGTWAQRYLNAVQNNDAIHNCLDYLDELLAEEIMAATNKNN